MSENKLITDVTELIGIRESSLEVISLYLAERPSLHALVVENGDVYYVQNNKIRLLKQLLRLIKKVTGKQPNTIEITESVYQSFLYSKREVRAEASSISPNKEVEELLVQAINLGVSDIHLHAWQSSFVEGASVDNQNVDNVASSLIDQYCLMNE